MCHFSQQLSQSVYISAQISVEIQWVVSVAKYAERPKNIFAYRESRLQPLAEQPVFGLRLKPRTSKIRSSSAAHLTARFDKCYFIITGSRYSD